MSELAILAYPLTRGLETGRGLERVAQKFTDGLDKARIGYDFYDRGILRNEWKAFFQSFSYLQKLRTASHTRYFAVYPVSAFFAGVLNKRPLVTGVHDLIPFLARGFDNDLKYAVKRFCIRYACQKSDALITGFPSIKEKITELFGVDPKKITVIPYGVDHDHYYPDETVKKVKNRIAFLGEAKRAKGIDSLIRVFKTVRKNLPDATLVLASNGHELEAMKKLAADILPQGSYEFVGFVKEDKMREFYNAADLFVFPSRYGFGLSALEAMACGTPAVLGRCLDSTDFISDEELLADPENTGEMAQKLTALLVDRQKYGQKREFALKKAGEHSWDRMARLYYETCLKAV